MEERRDDLLPGCYTVAINFAGQSHDKELLATLYSNRSLAYKRQEKWKESLDDAQKSVEINPKWAKVHVIWLQTHYFSTYCK